MSHTVYVERVTPRPEPKEAPSLRNGRDICTDGVAAYKAREYRTAITLFYRAIDKGVMGTPLYYLGLCSKNGSGTARDAKIALERFMFAAEYNEPAAMFEIGLICEAEPSLKINGNDALGWYLLSATKGYPPAMVKLGQLYETGVWMRLDLDSAIEWYARAAGAGDIAARAAIRRIVTSVAY